MNIILFTLSLSLFDSLSTTQQIIIFVLLLTTVNPLRNSIAYLAGLSVSYTVCGIIAYTVIEQLHILPGNYFPSTAGMPDVLYYQSELISGIIMITAGFWYYRKKRYAPPGRSQNVIISKLSSMNAVFACCMGIFISVSSFPLAVPYIIAVEKYAAVQLGTAATIINILIYNFSYSSPMIIILAIYLFARSGTKDLSGTLHEKARVLNVKLTTWAFAGVGVFTVIDAIFYFIKGRGLVNGRYL